MHEYFRLLHRIYEWIKGIFHKQGTVVSRTTFNAYVPWRQNKPYRLTVSLDVRGKCPNYIFRVMAEDYMTIVCVKSLSAYFFYLKKKIDATHI